MSDFWGSHERQGNAPVIVYKTVPEYQPSSASITLGGDPFYKTSGKTENISVRRTGLDTTGTILLIGVPVALILGWLLLRKS